MSHDPLIHTLENDPAWRYHTTAELTPETYIVDPRDGDYLYTADPVLDDQGLLRVRDIYGDLKTWEEDPDQDFLVYLP